MQRVIGFFLCLTLLILSGPMRADAGGPAPVVIMETSMGRIIVMLDPKAAPKTVDNFLKYVDAGFYDGTIFHRIIKQQARNTSFAAANVGKSQPNMNIVQGGGYDYPMRRKRPLLPPIVNESLVALSNTAGTIAMARTQDPNSATCQFFFNVEDNPTFDPRYDKGKLVSPGYCAFGKVIRGMDTLKKIQAVPTTHLSRHDDVPASPIYLKRAYRAK